MEAEALYRDGKLAEAVESCQRQLRDHPNDATHRTFLFELLAFRGDWDRALRQLQFLEQHADGSDWAAQVYRNLVTAEQARIAWARQGTTLPEFLVDPPQHVRQHIDACRAFASGDAARAEQLWAAAMADRREFTGRLNGQAFHGTLCDCDDTLAPVFEVLIQRDYAWIPWEQLRVVEVSKPERPRDLVWVPVRLELTDGSQRRGYAPTRYVDSIQSDDPLVQLGRLTDWTVHAGDVVTGLGLKSYLLGDLDSTILELTSLEIDADVAG